MANQKLTALTALASLSADDLFYVVDDPAGAANQRKMAASVLDARYLQDAPIDGSTYGRNNGAWAAVSAGSVLPVADTQTIVKGSADATKLLRFEVDGFSAGATRVMTPPNQDTTLAGLSIAQTFTVPQTITIGAGTDIGLVINTAGATPYGLVLAGNSRLGIGTYTPAYIADIQGGTLRVGDSTVDSRLRIEGNQEFMVGMRNGAANDYAWLGATTMGGFQFSNKFGDASMTIFQLGGVDLTQLSTTGARPTLKLTQLDLSEELIEFFGTVATGNPIEAVGAKTLTTTHFIRVSVNGSFLYIPVGTIA